MKTTINQRGEYGRGCAPNILCIISRHYLLCPLCPPPLLLSPSLCTHGSPTLPPTSRSNYDRAQPPLPSHPIHLHSSFSFLPSFVRIQVQKPMSENNESMRVDRERGDGSVIDRFYLARGRSRSVFVEREKRREVGMIEEACNISRLCRENGNKSVEHELPGCGKFGLSRPVSTRFGLLRTLSTLSSRLASRSSRVTLDRFTLLQTVPRGQRPDTYPFRRTTFHSTFVSVCLRNAEQTSRVTRFVVFRRASYVSSIRIRCPSPISPSKADQLLLPPLLFLLCAHLDSRIAKRGREQGTFITIRC